MTTQRCSWQMGRATGPLAYDCPGDIALVAPAGHQHAGSGFCKKHAVLLGHGDSMFRLGFQWLLPNGEKYYYNEPDPAG